jgi:uncharacterized cupin superfamily protein
MPTVFKQKDRKLVQRDSPLSQFSWLTTPRLGGLAHSKYMNFDIRTLDPGKFSFPFHFHRASEEFFLILSGEITLRTPEGFQQLETGDLVFFEEGPASAHQLYNHSDSPCTYLDVRAAFGLDLSEYPDTGKIATLPGFEIFEKEKQTEYFRGEEEVEKLWPPEIIRKKG